MEGCFAFKTLVQSPEISPQWCLMRMKAEKPNKSRRNHILVDFTGQFGYLDGVWTQKYLDWRVLALQNPGSEPGKGSQRPKTGSFLRLLCPQTSNNNKHQYNQIDLSHQLIYSFRHFFSKLSLKSLQNTISSWFSGPEIRFYGNRLVL